MTGVSFKARARGGVDVAVGDSPLSQIANPASLSLRLRDRLEFDFAGQIVFPRVKWEGPTGTSFSEVRVIPLFDAAVSIPVNERLTWGVAVHAKCGLMNRFHMRPLLMPWVKKRMGADAKNLAVYSSLAYKLTDRLSVGVGARVEVQTAEFSLALGPAYTEFGRGYAYGGGFQIGLHYQALENLAFGAAYRSPSWFGDLSGGKAKASLFGLVPIPLGDGNIDEFKLPQRISFGASWGVTERFRLAGEVRWINYSNSSLNSLTVATDGLVNLRVPLPLGYRDQWVFMVGAEFDLDDRWTVGVGYNYGRNPVAKSNLLPIGSVLAEHHITAGLRYERDGWWVGAGYVLGLKNSMSGGGASDIPFGIDYGLSEIEQTQHSLIVGFGFGW
jgi:long-chain fatty acid transport protein